MNSNCIYGIYLYYSLNNIISNNNINSNNRHGILLSSSSNNLIYLNSFVNNSLNTGSLTSQSNIWNSSERIEYIYKGKTYTNYMGNYWDDYTVDYGGRDVDGDGIGDFPYWSLDNYPLMESW